MKNLFTLLALMLCLTGMKAQYVTIPDANFVSWLQANVPTAMNGNQMDTTSLAVTTRTVAEIQPYTMPNGLMYSNLDGLQYFKVLKRLVISNQPNISSLPNLSNSIEFIVIENCGNITSIISLPTNLKTLSLDLHISTLPLLPTGLESLAIVTDTTFTWPQLPSGLKFLGGRTIQGSYAPQYLPVLPNGLKKIYCAAFQLDSLPQHLPDSLISLSCHYNPITSLPSLPNNLEILECSATQITTIPVIPASLTRLECGNNNKLMSLPNLPNGLKELICNHSPLILLPSVLPVSLDKLDCRNDSLTFLPSLPITLKHLWASNNQISCIPTLPNSLTYLNISNNPFTCLPNYLPTMPAYYFTYPLCTSGNTITNPNGCERADGIFGNSFFDTNANCLYDTTDTKLKNINFKLYDSNSNYTSQTSSYTNGAYNFTQGLGNYSVVLDTANLPYTAQCSYPDIDTLIQLTSGNPVADNVNFSVKCKGTFDVGVQSVLTSGIVFPGQNHNLKIAAGDMSKWYNLNCAAGVSGQLTINISGPVSYVAPAVGSLTPTIIGNSFTYNIPDFGNINNLQDFGLILKTDTTATVGDSICVNALITPLTGDVVSSNNSYHLCYGVVNSYDPNMKEVYPINLQPEYNDWLTYTIHFQNTGNAPAMNIRLLDTLDNNLDIESFKVINYSNNNTWSINNNILFFNFQNIQLPDSNSNPEGSKGYVQYKIKPKPHLGAGNKIKNTAYIYFDYNSPIVTNTTINEYLQVVSIKENSKNYSAKIYPNPTNGLFTIELTSKGKQHLQLVDMAGNIVLSQTIETGNATIDANHLAAGIYNISIKGNSSVTNKKLVIVK